MQNTDALSSYDITSRENIQSICKEKTIFILVREKCLALMELFENKLSLTWKYFHRRNWGWFRNGEKRRLWSWCVCVWVIPVKKKKALANKWSAVFVYQLFVSIWLVVGSAIRRIDVRPSSFLLLSSISLVRCNGWRKPTPSLSLD